LGALKAALERESVRIYEAQTRKETARWLQGLNPPHLVFTDAALSDGTWSDILRMAQEARDPVDVIVVSSQIDDKLYVDVIQYGAFDFITPALAAPDLQHVVRCAVWNARSRREAVDAGLLARAA
jgi:DNA-binding NtrC family response regulator